MYGMVCLYCGDVLNLRGYRLPRNAQIFWISTPNILCVYELSLKWERLRAWVRDDEGKYVQLTGNGKYEGKKKEN